MLLADMVIDASDPALEDGEIVLGRVGVGIAAHILADAVIDGIVFGEVAPGPAVYTPFIGHQSRISVNLCLEDGPEGLGADCRNVEGARPVTSLIAFSQAIRAAVAPANGAEDDIETFFRLMGSERTRQMLAI